MTSLNRSFRWALEVHLDGHRGDIIVMSQHSQRFCNSVTREVNVVVNCTSSDFDFCFYLIKFTTF